MRKQRDLIGYIISVVLYGTIGLFLRHTALPSEIVALCRGALGSLFIYVYLRLKGQRPDRAAIKRNLPLLLLSGISLGLNWVFLFAAYMHTSVAIASLCNYMAPMIVILIAPAVLREKLNKRKLPCAAAALLGIILVSHPWDAAQGSAAGVIFGLTAAGCFVVIVICNRKMQGIPSLDRSVIQLALSALTCLPYVLIKNKGASLSWDTRSVMIILMLGIVHTGIAYIFYFRGMASLPVQTFAILGYLEPVVSVLCSALFLREPLGLAGGIGTVLVIGAAVASEVIGEKQPAL